MKARTAHDQTAERKYMVPHGREQAQGSLKDSPASWEPMRWTQSLASDLAKGDQMLVCVASVVGHGDLLQVIVGDASGDGAQQGIGIGAESFEEGLDHGRVQCGD
jgi:hypothetical protein